MHHDASKRAGTRCTWMLAGQADQHPPHCPTTLGWCWYGKARPALDSPPPSGLLRQVDIQAVEVVLVGVQDVDQAVLLAVVLGAIVKVRRGSSWRRGPEPPQNSKTGSCTETATVLLGLGKASSLREGALPLPSPYLVPVLSAPEVTRKPSVRKFQAEVDGPLRKISSRGRRTRAQILKMTQPHLFVSG